MTPRFDYIIINFELKNQFCKVKLKAFLQTILNKNVTISRKIPGMNEYIIPLPFTLSVDISVYSVN